MVIKSRIIYIGLVLLLLTVAIPAWPASVQVQFPYDIDNPADRKFSRS